MKLHNLKGQGFRSSENSAFYKQKDFIFGAVLLLAILAFSAALYFSGVGCVWQFLFHRSCPSCGITRAYIALLHGDVLAAFKYNFMFPAVPVLAVFLLFGNRLLKRWRWRVLLGAIVLGFLIKWIISV